MMVLCRKSQKFQIILNSYTSMDFFIALLVFSVVMFILLQISCLYYLMMLGLFGRSNNGTWWIWLLTVAAILIRVRVSTSIWTNPILESSHPSIFILGPGYAFHFKHLVGISQCFLTRPNSWSRSQRACSKFLREDCLVGFCLHRLLTCLWISNLLLAGSENRNVLSKITCCSWCYQVHSWYFHAKGINHYILFYSLIINSICSS